MYFNSTTIPSLCFCSLIPSQSVQAPLKRSSVGLSNQISNEAPSKILRVLKCLWVWKSQASPFKPHLTFHSISRSASPTQQQGCHKVEISVWFRCLGLICDLIGVGFGGVGLICDLWLWVCFMVAVSLLVVAMLC